MSNKIETVQYGRLELRVSEFKGLSFEEAEKKYPHIDKGLLKGALKMINKNHSIKTKEQKNQTKESKK